MVQLIEIGSQAFNEIVESVRLQARITTEKELRSEQEVWLNTSEAMEYLKIGRTCLKNWTTERDSKIVVVGLHKNARYLKASLSEYLKSKRI